MTVHDPIPESPGIYRIGHEASSDFYIGQAENVRIRVNTHLKQLAKAVHPSRKLMRFAEQYGVDGLTFEVVELCEIHRLNEREQHYIETLKPPLNSNRGSGRGGWRRNTDTGPITFDPRLDEIERWHLENWAESEHRSVPDHVGYLVSKIVKAHTDNRPAWNKLWLELLDKA